MKHQFLIAFKCCLLCIIVTPLNASTLKSKLLLISLDGFRYDYLEKYNAPNIKSLAEIGISASEGMIPSFPSVTFCNHQTLVTGLYPESHGIVDNKMYDPIFNESFAYGNDSKWWSAAEPIWITAKVSGLKTGVSYWPGSTVKYNGIQADFFQGYKFKQNFSERVDIAIDWLKNKNLDLVVMYFEQPDGEGHKFGPESQEVGAMVKYVDSIVGNIITGLKDANIFDKINVIVTSDHGMAAVNFTKSNALILDKYLNSDDFIVIPQLGAIGAIFPKDGKEEKVFYDLNNKHPHVKIYHKKDIPMRLHYQHNRRIMPIIAIAEENYFVSYNGSEIKNGTIGIHGYDNTLINMRALFVASGPNFKKNVQLSPFYNIDIYSLLCHLLKVSPKPNNGSLNTFQSVLVDTSNVLKPSKYLLSITTVIFIFTNKN